VRPSDNRLRGRNTISTTKMTGTIKTIAPALTKPDIPGVSGLNALAKSFIV
jgi:hypothetical protein